MVSAVMRYWSTISSQFMPSIIKVLQLINKGIQTFRNESSDHEIYLDNKSEPIGLRRPEKLRLKIGHFS